jgi:hypothetical protein
VYNLVLNETVLFLKPVSIVTVSGVVSNVVKFSRHAARPDEVACPQCQSMNTTEVSRFGSTACKAMYRCLDCMEPFDYFKPY